MLQLFDMRETGGLEVASTITLVLQANRLTKCASHPKQIESEQIEHANYEYNTRQCLQRSRDYRLRIIIGSE